MMTAAPALPPDIPCVQKDASLHPRSFFFSSHVLCTASLKRPVQPPFPPRGKAVWGPWVPRSPSCDSSDAERGDLGSGPRFPAPLGFLLPSCCCSCDPLVLLELLCSSKKRKGGRGIVLEGCFVRCGGGVS